MAGKLKLHPKSFKELKDRLIFYVDKKFIDDSGYEAAKKELLHVRDLVVTGTKKSGTDEWKYQLHAGEHCFHIAQSTTKNYNFYLSRIISGEAAKKQIKDLYKKRIFTIIPSGGVFLIYNNQMEPVYQDGNTSSADWSMDVPVYNQLIAQMDDYFENGDDEETGAGSAASQVSPRFRDNIIKPFQDFTDKEKWVEQIKLFSEDGVVYTGREYVRSTDKGPVYRFFVDANAVQGEDDSYRYKEGDRITVVSPENERQEICTGVVESLDDISSSDNGVSDQTDSMGLTVAFFRQMNDADVPHSAKIVMAVNDTQAKVRNKVIKKLRNGQVESTYMYRIFKNFGMDNDGYLEPDDGLADFLKEKLRDKYPPNQMQLEAIIKGILTKDLLLVLGPPGTGKTTVISLWVEYFISQGKRVLISSQNNAAVDNVLERFDGKGEVVRLGNESKVQENCKKFLPHNKLETMWTKFSANRDAVRQQYDTDAQMLRHHVGLLEEYIAWQKQYTGLLTEQRQKKRALELAKSETDRYQNRISELIKDIERIDTERVEYQETAAALEIFITQMKQKPLLVRLVQWIYLKHANKKRADALSMAGALDEQQERDRADLAISRQELDKVKIEQDQTELMLAECIQRVEEMETRRPNTDGILRAGIPYQSDFCKNNAPSGLTDTELSSLTKGLEQILEIQKRLERVRATLEDWYGSVEGKRNDILHSLLLEQCQVVGATCIGINSNKDFANVSFDVSIVDESGQIQIHNALVPMSRSPKTLLLGDYKQIPPMANEDVVKACQADGIDTKLLYISFFEYLFERMNEAELKQLQREGKDKSALLKPVLEKYVPKSNQVVPINRVQAMIDKVTQDRKKTVNLNSQFRMPGVISDVISEWFYDSNYFSSYDMSNFRPMVPGTGKPLVVVSTSGKRSREETPGENGGYYNLCEAELVAELVAQVIKSQPEQERESFCSNIEGQIGIISAYGAQVRKIRECLRKRNLGITSAQINSMVNSLDSFQGQERPLILYSLTRSSKKLSREQARVGFMKELRRLNVAFTRCKKQLVILGDIDYLRECMYVKELEGFVPPCAGSETDGIVGLQEIEQCAGCSASCERKFARFMRLLMQHVEQGSGDTMSADFFLRKSTEGGEHLGV